MTQVSGETPSNIKVSISARNMETEYPELNCTGKLTRIGASKSYVFFVEIITKGQIDKGGRCPDGTITVARQGDDLVLSWFRNVKGQTVVAFGTPETAESVVKAGIPSVHRAARSSLKVYRAAVS